MRERPRLETGKRGEEGAGLGMIELYEIHIDGLAPLLSFL
jgi:hypothetical protein